MDEISVKITEFPTLRVSLGDFGAGSNPSITSHSDLDGRELADQHPISAITGLSEALGNVGGSGAVYVTFELVGSSSDGGYSMTADKTVDDITAAFGQGNCVLGTLNGMIAPMSQAGICIFDSLMLFEQSGVFAAMLDSTGAYGIHLPDNAAVSVSENGAGILEADIPFAILYEFLCLGTGSRCEINGRVYNLSSFSENEIVYVGVCDSKEIKIRIASDDSVSLTESDPAEMNDIPSVLPNPRRLVINGVEYTGEEEVNIVIADGSASESSLIGQTPLTLSEDATVTLAGSGTHSFSAHSPTVADRSGASAVCTNAELIEKDGYIELRSTGGSAFYESHVDFTFGGLAVGEKYKFVINASGFIWDVDNHITNGYYLLRDSGGNQLVQAAISTWNSYTSWEFTATTESVTVCCYPSNNMYFSSGNSVARIVDLYINRADADDLQTEVIDKSGSFTDSYILGKLPRGSVITADPACAVYGLSNNSSSASTGKPLAGKTVVCFGDSLFGMHTGETSAPAYAAERTGATVYNAGFGGCRMSVHPYTGYNEFSMYALADAIASKDWSAQDAAASSGSSNFPEQLALLKEIDFGGVDAIVIHYGTNDFTAGAGVEIDNNDDRLDTSTLCGALRYSIETLLGVYPALRIFVSLPAFRYWTADDGTVSYPESYTNVGGKKLTEFADALAAVAKEYCLPVIDCYHGLGINKFNATAFLSDGVHHNIEGRKRFGGYIGSRLASEF
jgi:lysophospholipase L1-like esterase